MALIKFEVRAHVIILLRILLGTGMLYVYSSLCSGDHPYVWLGYPKSSHLISPISMEKGAYKRGDYYILTIKWNIFY